MNAKLCFDDNCPTLMRFSMTSGADNGDRYIGLLKLVSLSLPLDFINELLALAVESYVLCLRELVRYSLSVTNVVLASESRTGALVRLAIKAMATKYQEGWPAPFTVVELRAWASFIRATSFLSSLSVSTIS